MAVQPADNKKKKNVIFIFAVAQLLVAALLWMAFIGSDDREARIKVALAATKAVDVQNAIAGYYADNLTLPADNKTLGVPGKQGKPYLSTFEEKGDPSYTVSVEHGVITLTFPESQKAIAGKTLVFIPHVSNGKLEWVCTSGTMDATYLPPQCQGQVAR